MIRLRKIGLVATLSMTISCIQSEQEPVSVSLYVQGNAMARNIVTVHGVPIFLDSATLAIGPVYLCAGTTAGDLCDAARLEWLDSEVVNLLDSEIRSIGTLTGVSGVVQSWMMDLGISSQLTREEPFTLAAAHELGGASVLIRGRANVDGFTLPFRAAIPIAQSESTELGIPVLRKSSSERFYYDIQDDGAGLIVQFDVSRWLQNLDVRDWVRFDSCAETIDAWSCDGASAIECGPDGAELQRFACDLSGQICWPGFGCQNEIELTESSENYRSIKNAVLTSARPQFQWIAAVDS